MTEYDSNSLDHALKTNQGPIGFVRIYIPMITLTLGVRRVRHAKIVETK